MSRGFEGESFADSNVGLVKNDRVAKSSIPVAHDALEQALSNLQEITERLESRMDNFMRPALEVESPRPSIDGANPDASREQNMIWNANRIVTQVTERLRNISDRIDF